MNTLAQTLLIQLADGQFHSGPALGQQFGFSRTAIWKGIQSLQKSGLPIYSVRGKGYRLAEPIELLNRHYILETMTEFFASGLENSSYKSDGSAAAMDLQQIEVFQDIESTNAYLLNVAKSADYSVRACLAEQQRAGRGRRGRRWISPFGGNLYLSLLWRFDGGTTQLGGLSLAVAVAVIRTMHLIGLSTAGLKWPNDILVNGRKLAGILLELSGEAAGPCAVVIGLGLNVRATAPEMSEVDQAWTDIESELGQTISRNDLAAQLLHQLIIAVKDFEKHGLQPFLKEWADYDVFSDCEVTLELPQGKIQGIARGVDESGALLLALQGEQQGELKRFHSGEVSMRARDPEQCGIE